MLVNIVICWCCISRIVKLVIIYKFLYKIILFSLCSLVVKLVSWLILLSCVISMDWCIWKKWVYVGNIVCYCWGWFYFVYWFWFLVCGLLFSYVFICWINVGVVMVVGWWYWFFFFGNCWCMGVGYYWVVDGCVL